MAKGPHSRTKRAKRAKRADKAPKRPRPAKSVRKLERRLDELAGEQRALRKRVKRLTRQLRAGPPLPPSPPPWAKGLGPVVSLEVPLETADPAAPLWATVAARLPEEITTVGDDGRVAHYRYSAAGSTPQAPRYRHLAEPPSPPSAPS